MVRSRRLDWGSHRKGTGTEFELVGRVSQLSCAGSVTGLDVEHNDALFDLLTKDSPDQMLTRLALRMLHLKQWAPKL
eukprot:6465647-Amphidinium_carterae.1